MKATFIFIGRCPERKYKMIIMEIDLKEERDNLKASRKRKLERIKAAQGMNRTSDSSTFSKRARTFKDKKRDSKYGNSWKKEIKEYI